MSSSQIESVMHEDRIFNPPADFASKARIPSMQAYNELCARLTKITQATGQACQV